MRRMSSGKSNASVCRGASALRAALRVGETHLVRVGRRATLHAAVTATYKVKLRLSIS